MPLTKIFLDSEHALACSYKANTFTLDFRKKSNKNYQNNLVVLQECLGINLQFDKEISFQEACANWKEEEIYDIYFTDNATICFLNSKKCTDPYQFENNTTLTFILSEYSMTFVVNYIQDNKFRVIMEIDGDRFTDDGDVLPEEENESDVSELIWLKIDQILGKTYGSIDLDAIAYRYIII